MSVLRPGDEEMHYCDGSHRWVAPPGRGDQAAWEERIREHQRQHQQVGRSSPNARPMPEQRTAKVPRQRSPQPAPRPVR